MSSTNKMKVHKRKKMVGELVADCIDNTAPVHKILADLLHKNVQAHSLYKQTVRPHCGRTDHFHFAVPGHPLNAFSEDWDGQLESNFFEPFNHKSFPPRMINSIKHNVGKSDPVTDLIKRKKEWFFTCRSLKVVALKAKYAEKYEQHSDDVVSCPKSLVDLAAHLDSDPDPYFNNSYNWYYAGSGNAQLVCINWVDYLLHSEFDCVYLTEFKRSNAVINSENAAKFECEGLNIFETICSAENIVALRTRNKIFILKIIVEGDDKIRFEKLKEMESEIPFTGLSFDGYHKNILYITTLDHNLSILNLHKMAKRSVKLKANIKTLVNNWNTVISTDTSFYTHIGTRFISLYDKRSNNMTYLWNDLGHVIDETLCNDISAAKQLELTHSVYVGTDHHLFLMDLRYTDSQKITPVQRWKHGMQCLPTYITKCNFEMGKDLICMSSQWCEDMFVLPNFTEYRKDMDMCNLTIPYQPPSILNALREARENKLCNSLYNPIDLRLTTAITGCFILEEGDKYNVFLHNSLGDLSCHTIFPNHLETFIVDDSSQLLHEWCESYKLPHKDFEVSSIEDISDLWKRLKKIPEDYLIGDVRAKERDKNRFNEKEIFDMFEKEELDSGLLEVWMKSADDTAAEQSSNTLNLHYSDSE